MSHSTVVLEQKFHQAGRSEWDQCRWLRELMAWGAWHLDFNRCCTLELCVTCGTQPKSSVPSSMKKRIPESHSRGSPKPGCHPSPSMSFWRWCQRSGQAMQGGALDVASPFLSGRPPRFPLSCPTFSLTVPIKVWSPQSSSCPREYEAKCLGNPLGIRVSKVSGTPFPHL